MDGLDYECRLNEEELEEFQTGRCLDCKSRIEQYEFDEMLAPGCGKLSHRKFYNSRTRYKCLNCGEFFTEFTSAEPGVPYYVERGDGE